MTARKTRTLQISESLNRFPSRSAREPVIGPRLILRPLLLLAIRFGQFAAAANSSKESFCGVRGTARCQTMVRAISITISASELVSAIVALHVMAGRADRQVPAVTW